MVRPCKVITVVEPSGHRGGTFGHRGGTLYAIVEYLVKIAITFYRNIRFGKF